MQKVFLRLRLFRRNDELVSVMNLSSMSARPLSPPVYTPRGQLKHYWRRGNRQGHLLANQ